LAATRAKTPATVRQCKDGRCDAALHGKKRVAAHDDRGQHSSPRRLLHRCFVARDAALISCGSDPMLTPRAPRLAALALMQLACQMLKGRAECGDCPIVARAIAAIGELGQSGRHCMDGLRRWEGRAVAPVIPRSRRRHLWPAMPRRTRYRAVRRCRAMSPGMGIARMLCRRRRSNSHR
jgi:hypothetical protein